MIDGYDWAGGREAMLRFGPVRAPVVVVAQPWLEEANRTRALIVAMLRALAGQGIAGLLPDLPGQSESLVATEKARLADWRAAFGAACDAAARTGPVYAVSVRAGALVPMPDRVLGHWMLAPAEGAAVARELTRLARLGAESAASGADTIDIAGNRVARALLDAVAAATRPPFARERTVRLADDPAIADHRIAAPPPWRRAEPVDDPALARLLAEDIADWLNRCAG